MNFRRLEEELRKVHKIKRGNIKKILRKKNYEEINEHRIAGMTFGTVWGIHDRFVPFNKMRKPDEFKNALRPCVVLESPKSFCNRCKIRMAPGTSRKHDKHNAGEKIFKVKVPPERLTKTTWFLLHFVWLANQNHLEKKFIELTTENIKKLENLLGYNNG